MASSNASRVRRSYGAPPVHLLLMLVSFLVVAYAVHRLGVAALWDPDNWWQSISVWFLGAAVAHDLVLFPIYAVADRALGVAGALMGRVRRRRPVVPVLNYARIPLMACGLVTLMFLPGVIRQGGGTYHRATGQTQEPFLQRWLVLCAAILVCGVAAYVVAQMRARWRSPRQVSHADPASPSTGAGATSAAAGPIPAWALAVVTVLVLVSRRRPTR